MEIPSDEWIERVNREFRANDVDVRRRPFLALDRYCTDYRVKALSFDSTPAKRIFEWFYTNTKPESHHIGSLFTGAYYYDACFWPVDIPVGYGQFKLEAPDSLRGMSSQMKQDLLTVPRDAWSYVLFWVYCLDYAFGFDDMNKSPTLNTFGTALLRNADRELRAAISQLLEHRPNSKAAMSSRMAVEIFLKAFLVLKTGLTEEGAKSLGHDLAALVRECSRVAPDHDLLKIERDLPMFPSIHERYTGQDIPNPLLWGTYGIAQYTAGSTVRSFTDRDSRSQMQPR